MITRYVALCSKKIDFSCAHCKMLKQVWHFTRLHYICSLEE